MKKPLLLLLLLSLSIFAQAAEITAGRYRVEVVTDPQVVPVGKATLIVKLTDASGNPVPKATVQGIAQMPGMPMGERMQMAVPGDRPGFYQIPASFAMQGQYEAKIAVVGPLGTVNISVPLATGESSAAGGGGGFPWIVVFSIVVGVGLVSFVIYRSRSSGQRKDVRPMLSGPALLALVLLTLVILGARYAVNNFRRPGSMTPLQAQTMNMDAPAPEGVTPVTLATAQIKQFDPTVRYAGQVVGFVEQDVYPRVTGTIVWMPFYVGAAVRKGQVLARLDTSQVLPQVQEKAAMVQSARSGVGSAQADYQQALAAVGEAQAQIAQRNGMIQEAEANLVAARESRDAAQAMAASAQADVGNAQGAVAAAEADQQYWQEESKRAASLLRAGAISKDEFQKTQADAAKSAAALRQASQAVSAAAAKARAATAQIRQADAVITAAQRKVAQARAELNASRAKVRTAEAAATSAKQKISQAAANVGAAEAGLQSAAATAGYAQVKAETDGVITQRLISPGVLVNPGQAILKLAQVQPIRVQANVAEADVARVNVGAIVRIRHRDANEKPMVARVSSVSPSLDPGARTGTVEALIPNRDKAYLPGQFVSMEIATSTGGLALVVPRSAIQTEVAPGESGVISTQQKHFVWVATPVQGQAGRFTLARTDVEIGESSGEQTAIKGGLAPGRLVVTSPTMYLRVGQIVVTATPIDVAQSGVPLPSAKQTFRGGGPVVQITRQGFEPASVSVKAGQPAQITFIRKTDNTCAKTVVFPALKLTKALPLNQPVTIQIGSAKPGQLSFACGMDMLKGMVVVR